MGDTKKIRKKYNTPGHPWIKSRIEEEKALIKEYGLKNKKEVWKMDSILKNYKDQIKRLAGRTDKQAEVEREQVTNKLIRYGLIKSSDNLGDVLGLEAKHIMERRLQTILVRKSLARSIKQARQLITHKHILVGENKISTPSYLVSIEEEPSIGFVARSAFFSEAHPERLSKEEIQKMNKSKAESKKEEGNEKKTLTPEEIEAEKIKEQESKEVEAELKKIEETTPDKKADQEVEKIVSKEEDKKDKQEKQDKK